MIASNYLKMTKLELATSQLNVAIHLYLAGEEFPAVITLAGAAEEVLGRLAEQKGHVPALHRSVKDLCATYKELWGKEGNPKDFVEIRNHARNGLKHIGDGQPLTMDFEREAAGLLTRALENYTLSAGHPHPLQRRFAKAKVDNWRSKQPAA